MATPELNHIILTVSDVSRSRSFYADLLGFDVVDVNEIPGGAFYIPLEAGVGTARKSIWVVTHPEKAEGGFSEFRPGLDHLAFTATSKEQLEALAEKLIAAGVDTKGVEQFQWTGNYYMAFRDPDNIQLEYWLP